MSASASKKKRKELLLSHEATSNDSKKASTGKKFLIGIIAVVVALALIITTGMLIKRNDYKVNYDVTVPAMTVGDYEVSVPMFNYFYTSILNNYLNSGYLNYGLIQQGTPLSQQAYMGSLGSEEAPSWEAHLIDETKTQISNTINLYLTAKEAGYELTDEDKTAIEDAMKAIRQSAKDNGYNFFGLTTDWFVADFFGNGCNLENYREFAELTQLCSGYAESKEEEFVPSDDEIAAEYAEHSNNYDLISYTLYTVKAEADGKDDSGSDTYSEDAIAAAKADADAAAAAFPEDDTTSATKSHANITQTITEEAADWLFDSARAEGDTTVFASEDGKTYSVVRFDSRETNEYKLANAYVVSFPYDAEDAEPENAKKFETLCKGLENGISEEDFIARAEKLEMTASVRAVDRYASFNDEILSFLYDSARKDGDVLTLAYDASSTYYVIRFVSFADDTYQTQLVKESLHHAAEDAWLDEVYAANTAVPDDNALANAYTDRIYG